MGLPSNTNALQNGFAQGYQIGRSLRFRSSASAYLNRTPSTTSDRRIWTASIWAKIGTLGVTRNLLSAIGVSRVTYIYMGSGNQIGVYSATAAGGGDGGEYLSTQVFRDPSAWYHIVVAYDSTQATSTNRIKVYINGVQITAWSLSTAPTLNHDTQFNWTSAPMQLAAYNASQFFDGYMAEVNFIDGQQLTPSSFGLYDSNGIWQPKKYTGTYGTNGFYLPFSNTTSTTTLVADASGNGNNWTPNNISLTSGVTYDSMLDSPTNSNVGGNFCVLNPLNRSTSALPATIVDGNLKLTTTTSGAGSPGAFSYAFSTFAMQSGKYYAEFIANYASGSAGSTKFGLTNNFTFNYNGGNYIASNFTSAYTQVAPGTIVQIAYDATNGLYWFGTNGTFTGDPAAGTGGTSLTAPAMFFVEGYNDSVNRIDVNANFGQRPFSYTPPSGYNALNTANLPQPLISNGANYMAATLYTGNGSTQTINNGTNTAIGTSFQPDFVWIKNRAAAVNHQLQNSNAGWQYGLNSNNTNAEYTDANAITGATSSGWSMNNNYNSHNQSGVSYVGWNWKAGAGTTSTNTSGTITSTVSVSAQSGFSVVTYTGTGVNNATVGHGLGVTPNMIILKDRDSNSVNNNWQVYHSSLTSGNFLYLNTTDAQSAISGTSYGSVGSPSSTIFTCVAGSVSSATTNESGDKYIAYCFAAVRGFSAMGSYTGNGSSDGPMVYLGFKPRWIMMKCSTTAGLDWNIVDTSRNLYNVTTSRLWADLSNAEDSTDNVCDILSNGFKLRSTNTNTNASGATFIYAAFAESPFNISRAR